MTPERIAERLAAIPGEQAATRAEQARLRARHDALERRWWTLDEERRRLALCRAIGEAVRMRYRARDSKLNDAVGKLLAVRRTRASVDFGALGTWTVPIEHLMHADDPDGQGFILPFRP